MIFMNREIYKHKLNILKFNFFSEMLIKFRSKLRTIRYGCAETLGTILTAILNMLVKLNDEQNLQESQIETLNEANLDRGVFYLVFL